MVLLVDLIQHSTVLLYFLDIQFDVFMSNATDLSHDQIYKVFDMLDVDRSGLIDFDEFYLLVCILISINVGLYHVLNTY